MKQLANVPCTPQWREGDRHLVIDRGVTNLRGDIIASVERRGSRSNGRPQVPSVADEMATSAEITLASASLDLDAARDGYNYVQLFSPAPRYGEDGGSSLSVGGPEKIEQQEIAEEARLMGQLVLRLNWMEPGAESPDQRGEHAILIVRGASGLANPDL